MAACSRSVITCSAVADASGAFARAVVLEVNGLRQDDETMVWEIGDDPLAKRLVGWVQVAEIPAAQTYEDRLAGDAPSGG